MADFEKIHKKIKRLKSFIENDVGEIIGTEAVRDAKENFERQSFDGKRWKDVKRRDPNSTWYGFKYGSNSDVPSNHARRRGAKGKYTRRKSSSTTNYSPTATKTPILSSQESNLENSIQYRVGRNYVLIYSDLPYAEVHQNGGTVKVFGKKSVKMPKRQFMGMTKKLRKKINNKIDAKINAILK